MSNPLVEKRIAAALERIADALEKKMTAEQKDPVSAVETPSAKPVVQYKVTQEMEDDAECTSGSFMDEIKHEE